MPPVIALAACHTDVRIDPALPSFAGQLLDHGAVAVLATETAVSDRYATSLFSRIYATLAAAAAPDVVAAVADARRRVHTQLQDSPNPADREIGEFVGRRREQRRWPAQLLDRAVAGMVLTGIGGIGKTTLADELIRRVQHRDPDRLPVTLTGPLSVDTLLAGIAAPLRLQLLRTGAPDQLGLLELLSRVDLPWRDRLSVLTEHLDRPPLLVVLDNFEDNLGPPRPEHPRELTDPVLAGVLAAWVGRPGPDRLLVTSRYRFTLPDAADRALLFHQLGPLSFAETLKLVWSLPTLDRLTSAEIDRVWRQLGGHPRTLEYLDALLAGGTGRYPDVTQRLAAAVARRLYDSDAQRQLFTARSLDASLAATATLAASDAS